MITLNTYKNWIEWLPWDPRYSKLGWKFKGFKIEILPNRFSWDGDPEKQTCWNRI